MDTRGRPGFTLIWFPALGSEMGIGDGQESNGKGPNQPLLPALSRRGTISSTAAHHRPKSPRPRVNANTDRPSSPIIGPTNRPEVRRETSGRTCRRVGPPHDRIRSHGHGCVSRAACRTCWNFSRVRVEDSGSSARRRITHGVGHRLDENGCLGNDWIIPQPSPRRALRRPFAASSDRPRPISVAVVGSGTGFDAMPK